MLFATIKSMVRGEVKYYFVDSVRKGGTPPPLRTKILPKKVMDLGGTPPSPFTDIFPKNIL